LSLYTGRQGQYEWLASGGYDLHSLLQLCPEVFLDKYLAVTSFDSGSLVPNDAEKNAGWVSEEEIAYSPQIMSTENLPHDLYDEWYVFCQPRRLGSLAPRDKNIFEASIHERQVHNFVNFGALHLHKPDMKAIADLFWQQLSWIAPESYVADGECLAYVSSNEELFAKVKEALSKQ
jgi:hypothetical protein